MGLGEIGQIYERSGESGGDRVSLGNNLMSLWEIGYVSGKSQFDRLSFKYMMSVSRNNGR